MSTAITKIDDAVVYRVPYERFANGADIQKVMDELIAVAEATPAIKLAIDFGQVKFISSLGLGMLAAVCKTVRGTKGTMAIFAVSPSIRKVFAVTKMDTLFAIEADQAAALLGFKKKTGGGGFWRR